MNTSLFELFKIGIGPSSSHTVGPMRAALRFVRELNAAGQLEATASLRADLYGSLALTGIGHATDRAVLLGLLGEAPDTVDPALVEQHLAGIRTTGFLPLFGRHPIPFTEPEHLLFHLDQMFPDPGVQTHPNGVRFSAFDTAGALLRQDVFFSIGGGFILSQAEFHPDQVAVSSRTVPYPFSSAAELLHIASDERLTIANLLLANEVALLASDASINRPPPAPEALIETAEDRIRASIFSLWRVMQQCTERGVAAQGILPGGLNVRRRAHRLAERLNNPQAPDPLAAIDWVTLYAMAVNEENAAGGRVVTAPTNGAAGVIPAIAHYYMHFIEGPGQSTPEEKQDGPHPFLPHGSGNRHSLQGERQHLGRGSRLPG